VVTAGVISPLLWDDPLWLALGMVAMMLGAFTCWQLYLRTVRTRAGLPPELPVA